MSRNDAISLAYLATIIAFILALRFLSSPKTAVRGNRIGALGMVVAIAATFAQTGVHNDVSILIVMAASAPVGAYAARDTQSGRLRSRRRRPRARPRLEGGDDHARGT
jgi:NAD(P) transhydrogenase subunit beta